MIINLSSRLITIIICFCFLLGIGCGTNNDQPSITKPKLKTVEDNIIQVEVDFVAEAEKISQVFTESLRKDTEEIAESLDFLLPLIALKKHRSRIKCMKLAWEALEDCARQNQT